MKLHLSDLPNDCNADAPVVENLVKYLISDSSMRSRRNQDIIVKGLATVPKVYNTIPSLEQSKQLMIKTITISKDGEDMPMHYPGLNMHNKGSSHHLSTSIYFSPSPSPFSFSFSFSVSLFIFYPLVLIYT